MAKSKSRNITKKEFDNISTLLQTKMFSFTKIAHMVGRSPSTIGQIDKWGDFESYVEYNRERLKKQNIQKSKDILESITPPNTYPVIQHKSHNEELIKQLTRIADSLDKLTKLSRKKRIF